MCDGDCRVSGWLGLGGSRTLRPRRQCHTRQRSELARNATNTRTHAASRQQTGARTRARTTRSDGEAKLSPLIRSETCRSARKTHRARSRAHARGTCATVSRDCAFHRLVLRGARRDTFCRETNEGNLSARDV